MEPPLCIFMLLLLCASNLWTPDHEGEDDECLAGLCADFHEGTEVRPATGCPAGRRRRPPLSLSGCRLGHEASAPWTARLSQSPATRQYPRGLASRPFGPLAPASPGNVPGLRGARGHAEGPGRAGRSAERLDHRRALVRAAPGCLCGI